MKRLRVYSLLATFLLAGCTEQPFIEITGTEQGAPPVVSAQVDDESARLHIDSDALLRWDSGDEISLFPTRSNGLKYRFGGESGSRYAEFTLADEGSMTGTELACNYALYPYREGATAADGSISTEFPATQHYAERTFGAGANVMVAATSGKTLEDMSFKNAGGYLKLSLYGLDITVKSITLTGNNNEKIAGPATITTAYGTRPSVTMADDAATSITIDCGKGVKLGETRATATEFWLAMPQTSFKKGFSMTVTDTNGKRFSKSTSNKVVVRRNTILPMAAIEVVTVSKVGAPLPAWEEGWLDMHFINSGRGECTFYILPDGTTLLVDAGELKENYKESDTSDGAVVPQRPNTEIRPYMVYANYIKHFMPAGRTGLNWCLASHFHIDHIGDPSASTETAEAGYCKAGLIALYDEVPFHRIVDRAYPEYKEDSSTPAMEGSLSEDWKKFIKWGVDSESFYGYRFEPGKELITLRYNRKEYSNFKIFNVCANGYADDGSGNIEGEKSKSGNPASCGFHLSYGDFDYLSCGDLTSRPQNLTAKYARNAIGAGKLDAFKAHHHLGANSWGSQMQIDFQPRVIIGHTFYKKHLDTDIVESILKNIYGTWSKDIFATNLHEQKLDEQPSIFSKLTNYNGHIVLRVAPDGSKFYVYLLDDSNFEYRVKAIHGPYTSK